MEDKLNDFLRENTWRIAGELREINRDTFFREKTIGFAGKERVRRIIVDLRAALFPGVYEPNEIDESHAQVLIENSIGKAALELDSLLALALSSMCPKSQPRGCDECKGRAQEITRKLVSALPQIRMRLQEDMNAAYEGDPAAASREEILLCYPSMEAVSIYRIAHVLYEERVPIIPRMMSEYAHERTGIDIHPGASIGRAFFIDHGTGVVIGETCVIGDNVKLYQGVTLGARSFDLDAGGNPIKGIKRHPNIEDNVIIYPNATILGGDVVIGKGSVIGGNAWITRSIPPDSVVYNPITAPRIIDKGSRG